MAPVLRILGPMTARIPLILDCDPGHDDALAIIVALARPELELLAVTTVAGQRRPRGDDPERASRPDPGRTDGHPGRGRAPARPLLRELHVARQRPRRERPGRAPTCPSRPSRRAPEGAIELIRSILEAAPEPVTIAAVGPLTNIALLLRTHPELVERIASIRIMGGAITEGNTTASAEFNIWQDPEAARIVLDCGRPITLMTLDVTHQALFTRRRRRAARGPRARGSASVFADLLRYFSRFHAERYGWDGSPIHDAVTVAHLAVPDLVRTDGVPRRRRDDERADARPDGRRPPRADRQAAERGRRHRHRPDAVHRPADRRGRDGRGARG